MVQAIISQLQAGELVVPELYHCCNRGWVCLTACNARGQGTYLLNTLPIRLEVTYASFSRSRVSLLQEHQHEVHTRIR
jgi:hypothetical protein